MLTLLLIAAVVADSIPEIINRNPNSTWVAIDYPASVITHAKLRSKIGARFTPHRVRPYRDSNKVPDTFDSRERWPDAILPVRDQGDCGSCWAFSIAETIGDRLGVLGCSRGDIAPEDLVSCDIFDDGCDGGFIDMAWDWCQENGLATEECIPYKAGEGVESPCPETCEDGSAIYRTPVDS
ncbi:MAG: putative cathepsin B2 cysteine protease, partial [Streblomastix strix]